MSRTLDDDPARGEARALQGDQVTIPLRLAFDDVVFGAVREQESGLVGGTRDVGERRSLEVASRLVQQRYPEKLLGDVVAYAVHAVVFPLLNEVVHAVNGDHGLDPGTYAGVRIVRIARCERF